MEQVTHGITLDGVARFVDIATDALSSAREEIDALNVYPVPDGDTGTNMFLTVSAARDALRAALAERPRAVPRRRDGRARPGRAHGCARQLRGDPQPDAARLRPPPRRRRDRRQAGARRSPRPWPRRRRPAMPPSARPSRARSSACRRAASDAAMEAAGRGARTRDVFTAAAAGRARGPRPYAGAARRAAQAGVVDAGGRGLCVVLDAVETTATGRRPDRRGRADRHPPHPGRRSAPGRRPHRGRPGATR